MKFPTDYKKLEGLAPVKGKYQYNYPNGLDLQPGSDLHDQLVQEIRVRAREALDIMKPKYSVWDEIDKTMGVFVSLTDAEKAIKDKDARKPLPLVIPAGIAMVETMMAFSIKVFLESTPVHSYTPEEPGDTYGTILLEALVEWQNQQFRNDLAEYKMMRDAYVYGFGVVTPRWTSEWGWKPRRPTLDDEIMSYFSQEYRIPNEWSVLSEGNELVNIDPRLYWPDPNVPIDQPQKAEFVSWMEFTHAMQLLSAEKNNGDFFNCRYLTHFDARSWLIETMPEESVDNVILAGGHDKTVEKTHPVHVLWMFINLVPKDWGLGDSEYPEKWVFGLAGDSVLIQAQPQGLTHNRFPVAVAAPDTNGRDITPLSRVEMFNPMYRYADWMLASEMEMRRVSANGRFLIDPSLINMHDMADTTRRFVRARRSQWGKGNLAAAFQQFTTTGPTAGYMNDAAILLQMSKDISGAVDTMQGVMQTHGERRSATEARGAHMGANAKMERIAFMISRQAMRDIGYLLGKQTQQLMTRRMSTAVLGSRSLELQREFGITANHLFAGPMDIQVGFDCAPRDNMIPSGDYADTWVQLFQTISGDPEIRQLFDIPRVFMHLGRILGAKNVQQFLKNGGMVVPQIASTEAVMNEAGSNGDFIPMAEVA